MTAKLKTHTLGCKVNQYETQYLREGLLGIGYTQAEESEPTKVLAIFAHPDDELFVAPALARAAREGEEVTYVYATSGDQGPGGAARVRGPGDDQAPRQDGVA